MANEGATTVATIKGDLKLDIDDWKAKIAVVKADADELGSKHPNIKVEADTTTAQAAMAATAAAAEAMGVSSERAGARVKATANDVAAAEAKQAAAATAATLAAKAEEIAAMRLEEAQAKRGHTDLTVAAAELALERATARTTAAQEKNIAAGEALAATRAAAASAAAAETAAQDGETGAINRTNTAQNGHIQRWQMIIGLIGAAIPLIAPLAGYIVGVGGAMAGMGAAGVLAIYGVVQAMKQGNEVGQQYSSGLKTLKSDLDDLGGTAAAHMLGTFNDSVRLINGAMPELNREIGGFANQLGGAGLSVLQGVINAFHVLNPLFVLGGQYVQQLAAGFEHWTSDGGLQTFANEAVRSLPQVGAALGNLLTLILHIIDATAPIGTVMVQAINLVAAALNGVPVDVLTTLATGAIAVLVAYKGWSAISGIAAGVSRSLYGVAAAEDAAGASATAASGPLGIIIALLAAAAVGGVKAGNAVRSGLADAFGNSRTVQQYSDAVANGNVNIDHLGRVLQMTTGWMNEWANTLSFGTSAQSQAYDETKKLDQALSTASPKNLAAGYKQIVDEGKKVGLTQQDIANRFPLATAAVNAQKTAVDGAKTSTELYKSTVDLLTDAEFNVAQAVGAGATKYRDMTDAQGAAKNATDQLKQALDLLNGNQLSAAQAQNSFDSAIANMSKHLNAAGTMINRANTLLTGNTAAAVANRGELIQLTQSAEQNAEAFRNNGGSADETRKKLIAMKKAIVDAAVAHGEDRKQVQAFVDAIYKIPKSIPPLPIEVENSPALRAIAATERALNALDGSTVTVYIAGQQVGDFGHINTGGASKIPIKYAGGGTVGGPGSRTQDRVMASLSPSEEVISNDRGQADRWRPVLKMINADQPAGSIAGKVNRFAGTQPAQVVHRYYTIKQNIIAQPGMDVAAVGRIAAMHLDRKIRRLP